MTNKNTETVYDFYSSKLADPKSLKDKNVCLLALGNVKYETECKKQAKIVLILRDSNSDDPFSGIDFKDINSLKERIAAWLRKNSMKMFDVIVMNPPYAGNLHLKILETVIPFAEKIVNISPIRWLQDPLAKYKKHSDYIMFEQSISKKIETLDIIPSASSNDCFDIQAGDLGIMTCKKGGFDYARFNKNEFVDKIVNKCKTSIMDISTDEGYRGEYLSEHFATINSHFGDGTRWISDSFELFTTKRETHTNKAIFFSSDNEVVNCFNYLTSAVMRFYAIQCRKNQRVPWQFVPALDFNRSCTDKCLCDFFGITGYISDNEAEPGSEWETILNVVKDK